MNISFNEDTGGFEISFDYGDLTAAKVLAGGVDVSPGGGVAPLDLAAQQAGLAEKVGWIQDTAAEAQRDHDRFFQAHTRQLERHQLDIENLIETTNERFKDFARSRERLETRVVKLETRLEGLDRADARKGDAISELKAGIEPTPVDGSAWGLPKTRTIREGLAMQRGATEALNNAERHVREHLAKRHTPENYIEGVVNAMRKPSAPDDDFMD